MAHGVGKNRGQYTVARGRRERSHVDLQLSGSLTRLAQSLDITGARRSYVGVPQHACIDDYIIYLEVAKAHELADELLMTGQ